MFAHRNIHKFTSTSPDEKTHSEIDHILIDRRRHTIVLDNRSLRAGDCDPDHHLMVAKVRESLEVCKQTMHKFHMERFNLRKLSEAVGKDSRDRMRWYRLD
jgi:hypothetical protein